ncbi:MAG: hypothetical protein R2932_24005 [Caldilineaceae bacterium]
MNYPLLAQIHLALTKSKSGAYLVPHLARFDVHYHYRLHRPEGWTAWYNISALDLILMADSSFDQVEMEATAWNFWNKGQVTSASRLVQVTATPSNPGGAMDEFVSLPMIFR